MKQIQLLFPILFSCFTLKAQENEQIVTSDISHFWEAYDSLGNTRDSVKTIQRLYIDRGTPVLRSFIKSSNLSATQYVYSIRKHPKFWKSIRPATVAVIERKENILRTFDQIRAVYPDFKVPEVYFVIGCISRGGTTSRNRVVIGTELAGADSQTDKSELNSWQRSVVGNTGEIETMVAHEVIHTQQKMIGLNFIWGFITHRLLTLSLNEGAADFVTELATSKTINKVSANYGTAHEQELWLEFQGSMMKNNLSKWLYNGSSSKNRPADLGYFMGAQVCKSYYDSQTDKARAIRKIIRMKYGRGFLRKSGYRNKFNRA